MIKFDFIELIYKIKLLNRSGILILLHLPICIDTTKIRKKLKYYNKLSGKLFIYTVFHFKFCAYY